MSTRFGVENFGFARFSGLYLWAGFIVFFGFMTPDLFLTSSTVHSVASQQAIAAIVGLAVVVPLACGSFDLSIGANVGFAAVLVSILQQRWDVGMWPAIGICLLCGALIGFVNGFIVVVLGVSSFIATLGVGTLILAFQSIVTNDLEPLPATGEKWTSLTQDSILGFQMIFWYMLIVAAILWWILEVKPVGRYIYAVGGNEEAAKLSGVRTGRFTWISLIICGTVTSLAGVFYASYVGPSLTFGSSLLLPAYAAAFLGFTQIRPGRFNIWGSVVAVYVLATGVRGLQYMTSVQWLNDMFNGTALIVAVAFAVWRQKARVSGKPAARKTRSPDKPPPQGVAEARVVPAGSSETLAP